MADFLHQTVLQTSKFAYQLAKPFIFRSSPQKAHTQVINLLETIDALPFVISALANINRLSFKHTPLMVGGIDLPFPFILAAGFVKGKGYTSEKSALEAVLHGDNIIPGWRTMPSLVGPVEFGSFTRWAREGNSGNVMWRDIKTHSTQNRIGLKNPGAFAAAAFLASHRSDLPPIFGINIAVSPGVDDLEQERTEVIEAFDAFCSRKVYPSWFTLNISCPNTEDDPGNHQTETRTYDLCKAVIHQLRTETKKAEREIPLWVKISPGMADSQYETLMRVFHEVGVKAVIATNTLAEPTSDNPNISAGIGGGKLHAHALHAVQILNNTRKTNGYNVDIIGCGGIQDPASYYNFCQNGAQAVQYWSGMIYKSPLLAALILSEIENIK